MVRAVMREESSWLKLRNNTINTEEYGSVHIWMFLSFLLARRIKKSSPNLNKIINYVTLFVVGASEATLIMLL